VGVGDGAWLVEVGVGTLTWTWAWTWRAWVVVVGAADEVKVEDDWVLEEESVAQTTTSVEEESAEVGVGDAAAAGDALEPDPPAAGATTMAFPTHTVPSATGPMDVQLVPSQRDQVESLSHWMVASCLFLARRR
jgi:hypothetical protein